MAHELDMAADGSARMMYNGRTGTPWHGLGTSVDGLATAEEAILAAKLDWRVCLEPAYQKTSGGPYREVPDRFLVVRDEDDRVLGQVSKRYVPVQNREAFDFTNALVDSDEAIYDTAGALKGGRKVFLSAKLPEGTTVGDDAFDGHLLFSCSHDGLSAVTARYVKTRVVCANTLAWAFGEAVPVWSFPHVTGIEDKLAQARETLKLVTAYDREFALQAERLMATAVSMKEIEDYLREALPDRQRSEENVLAVKRNVLESPTIADDQRKTGWGLVNGLTEWQQHLRPTRSLEGRFHSVVDGDAARSRDRLVRKLLTV